MTTYYTHFESSIGSLLLLSNGTALTGLFMNELPDLASATADDNATPFPEVKRQLTAYFAGELTNFDLPLSLTGTEFQRRVWSELEKIPFGETISYGELAKRIGDPNASRAVGLANGRNPISIVVPCHRVIGANGKLTGYGGGLPRKQELLSHERGLSGLWAAK